LNILYYCEPNLERGGGVNNVAYYLPMALRKKASVTYLPGIRSKDDFLKIYFNVLDQFVKKKIDIIHFNTNPSWINGSSLLLRFANLRQAHTVLTVHDIPYLEQQVEQISTPFSFHQWSNIMRHSNLADRIVVNSEFMRNNVVTWYRINYDKIVVIPNGVDLKRFDGNNDRLELEGDPSVLCVGHISMRKGVDVLIQAIAKLKSELPNIKLHLVGGGNNRYAATLAKAEGIEKKVIFHGWAKRSLLPSYYKSADICVFASRHEGFGIVVLEAMASKTPVIASDIPSFREIISNGTDGMLFEPQNVDALSNEVITLYQDQNLRKELSRNAFEKVQKYSWEKIAEKYISLYKYLCEYNRC
jgi:glycosyltransferase involved in cell wall biosynthesis